MAECIAKLDTIERITPGRIPEGMYREHYMRYVFAADFVSGQKIVDIACGNGIGTAFLKRAGALRCVGIDIDSNAVDFARQQYPQCEFQCGDATCIDLPNACADVVVSFETIEHVEDPNRLLAECRRILKSDGIFLCSTPSRRITKWYPHNPFHVREWLPEEFCALVRRHFPIFTCYGQVFVNYPALIARRLAVRAAEMAGFKATLRRRIVGEEIMRTDRFFDARETFAECAVRQMGGWWAQPSYMVIVAKSTSQEGPELA